MQVYAGWSVWLLSAICIAVACSQSSSEEPAKKDVMVTVPPLGTGAFRIPALEDIRQVEVELTNASDDLPNIKEFALAKEYLSDVYCFFEGAEVDRSPVIGFPDSSSVRLTLKSGEVMRIAVHQVMADKPLQFSISGVRLRQPASKWKEFGGSGRFESQVRRVYFWQTGHITLKLPSLTLEKLHLSKPSQD